MERGLTLFHTLAQFMSRQKVGTVQLLQYNAAVQYVVPAQGRFLALCGFGNLPGDITFLDKKADGKCKVISQVR